MDPAPNCCRARNSVARRLNQRCLGRDVMADDTPLAILARNDPADLDRERQSLITEIKIRRACKIDRIGADLRDSHFGELNGRRRAAR
jgi:hypothetical protein